MRPAPARTKRRPACHEKGPSRYFVLASSTVLYALRCGDEEKCRDCDEACGRRGVRVLDGLDRISCFVVCEAMDVIVRRVVDMAHCLHILGCGARNEPNTGDAMVVLCK